MSIPIIKTCSLESKYGLCIDSEIETRQLGSSKQDHVAYGNYSSSTDTHTYWIAAFDGHGNNQAANKIRSAPLDDFMQNSDSWRHLQEFINSDDKVDGQTKLNSGSTMVYAKVEVSPTGIDVSITNIGDSTAVVFLNGEPIFVTIRQNYENGAEMARLIKDNRVNIQMPFVKKHSNFEVLSPTTVRPIEGTYIEFVSDQDGQILSMSQSLGHCGITGLKPDVTLFNFNPTDNIKVVLFSDGVSDVMPVTGVVASSTLPFMTTPTTILNEAERRWKQEWNIHAGTDLRKIYKNSFSKNGYDDCCCAMITIQPAIVSAPLPPSVDESNDESAQPKTDVEKDTDI